MFPYSVFMTDGTRIEIAIDGDGLVSLGRAGEASTRMTPDEAANLAVTLLQFAGKMELFLEPR